MSLYGPSPESSATACSSGHDHFLFAQPVYVNDPDGKPLPIFQAGEHYKYVGKLHFTVDKGKVTMNDYAIINVDAAVRADSSIQGIVEDLKSGITAKFGDLYHTVIGEAKSEVTKRYDQAQKLDCVSSVWPCKAEGNCHC